MTSSSARALALASITTIAACGGQSLLVDGTTSDSGAASDAGAETGEADATTSEGGAADPCRLDLPCRAGTMCAFPVADGCTATGVCVAPNSSVLCDGTTAGCGCDGTLVSLTCNGLPDGFTSKPVRAAGACGDGG